MAKTGTIQLEGYGTKFSKINKYHSRRPEKYKTVGRPVAVGNTTRQNKRDNTFVTFKRRRGKSTLLAMESYRENNCIIPTNCSLSVIHGAYISRNQPTTNTSYDLFDGQMAFPKRINDNLWIIP